MELRLRRRRSGETLSALHQDVRRLMALAHPTLPQDARESIACDYYIDALDDADFAMKVKERAPANLDKALLVSLQLETWQKDARRRRNDGDRSKPKVRGSVLRAVPPEQSSSYLDDCFNRLEENFSRLMDEFFNQAQKSLSMLGQKSSTPAATDRASGTERPAPDVSKPVEERRLSASAPISTPRQAWSKNQASQRSNRQPDACWKCGMPGHIQRNCTQPAAAPRYKGASR